MCELFRVLLNIHEILIENIEDEAIEYQEVLLSLEFMGKNVESEVNYPIILTNGIHEVESNFVLQSNDMLDNEDFMFNVFGNLLKCKFVNL